MRKCYASTLSANSYFFLLVTLEQNLFSVGLFMASLGFAMRYKILVLISPISIIRRTQIIAKANPFPTSIVLWRAWCVVVRSLWCPSAPNTKKCKTGLGFRDAQYSPPRTQQIRFLTGEEREKSTEKKRQNPRPSFFCPKLYSQGDYHSLVGLPE